MPASVVLLLLWLLATLLNLNKAFHIDDTFHLEAAQWIEHHPLQPMSGTINWGGESEPMHAFNQPPLYFYFIAIVGHFFGYTELPLHLFQSVFTFLCIYFFYRIAQLVQPRHALLLTAFFVLNPAFLVNQNLMVDIPLLSFHLLFIYFLIAPGIRSGWVRYGMAGVFLSVALLIKYTSLPLLALLLLVPLLRKHYAGLLAVLVPIGVLAAWTAFNYAEFGAAHIINRPTNTLTLYGVLRMSALFILCLSTIVPYFLVLALGYPGCWRRYCNILAVITISGFFLVAIAAYQGILDIRIANRVHYAFVTINGLVLTFVLIKETFRYHTDLQKLASDSSIVLLWLLVLAGFLILFAPFMATRHVLLCLPAMLLLTAGALNKLPRLNRGLALFFAFAISLLVGISDWIYADAFRKQAFAIRESLPAQARVWTVGNWGWQWYSRNAGMLPYDEKISEPAPGDYVVIPAHIAQQDVSAQLKLKQVGAEQENGQALTFFSNAPLAGLYTSWEQKIPWNFSKGPIARFKIYRVVQVAD